MTRIPLKEHEKNMATAIKYDVFLSYCSQDHDQINALADKLKAQNLRVYQDLWFASSDLPWQQKLEQVLSSCSSIAICIGRGEMGSWQQREIYFALERKKSEPDFPVIPVLLPGSEPVLGLLGLNVWIDLRQRLDQSLPMSMLAAVIRRRPLGQAFQARIKETNLGLNPYKGLAYFREEDAPLFYGRDDAIKKLKQLLKRNSMVTVVGASGIGKSSLVRAGLLPELRRDIREPWEILTIVPGDSPLTNLTASFIPLLYPGFDEDKRSIKMAEHLQALEKQPGQLINWINMIGKIHSSSSRFLLVVDQWEELYTLQQFRAQKQAQDRVNEPDQAIIFINALLAAAESKVLSVVLTVRADFMGHTLDYRPLADRVQDAVLSLGPMNNAESRLAIEKPAGQLGVEFEEGLVDSLLNDAAAKPGGLPLLEFALQRLWDDADRQGGYMRLQAYTSMHHLNGALTQAADEAYRTLSDPDQKIAQRVLMELVQTGDGVFDISRRKTISELGAEALPVINHLIDCRFLMIKRGADESLDTVELTHEILIRQWHLLKSWLIDDRQFDIWREKLGIARKTGKLLHGHELAEALRWRRMQQDELDKEDLDFIEKSNRHTLIRKSKIAASIVLPLSLLSAFALWVGTEELLTPKLGIYVLLAKVGITYFIEPEMVDIPPEEEAENGNALTFAMGPKANEKDSDKIEFPQHRVTLIKPLRMSRYEITFDQYQVFAYLIDREGGCADKHKVETSRVRDENWGRGDRPAINVSWSDATCYAQWLTQKTGDSTPYRLPTEAEWEFAARAGTESPFWWGNAMEKQMAVCDGCQSAWEGKNERKQTAEVDDPAFKPNGWGLYHTSGNVWEWVQDCWHENYESAPSDGSAWVAQNNGNCGQHVLRGGSWVDTPVGMRSAYRYKLNSNYRYYNVGFRIAQDG